MVNFSTRKIIFIFSEIYKKLKKFFFKKTNIFSTEKTNNRNL